MRFRLIPRDEGFFDLFSQAAVNIDEGARVVAELLADLTDIPSSGSIVSSRSSTRATC